MSDEQIISILKNTEWFSLMSPINYIIRWIGWAILRLLAVLSNSMEKVVNEIYSLNGFFQSPEVTKFIKSMIPLAWVVLAIAIGLLGLKIIFDREFKINSVIKNIALTMSIVILLPMGMEHLRKMTNSATEGLKTEYKLSANKILKDNVFDLYYLDSHNFSNKSATNNIPADSIDKININEEIDTGEVENKDVFTSKIITNEKGEQEKGELVNSFFGMFSENYFRYNFRFWSPFITLLCTTVALLASSIKVARIIFELGFVKLFGILYSFSDISSGQKTKEIIRCILSNFIVMFIISVLLKMYLMFSTWATAESTGVTQTVLLIGASLAVVDGPNIVERILGIDSGVKSGWNAVAAGYAGAKGAKEIVAGAVNAAGKVATSGGIVGAGIAGLASGLKGNKNSSLEEQMAQSISDKKDSDSSMKDNNEQNIHDALDAQKAQNSSVKDESNIKADANADLKDSIKMDTNTSNIGNDDIKGKSDDRPEPIDKAMNDMGINNMGESPIKDMPTNSSMSDMPPKLENDMNSTTPPPIDEAMRKEASPISAPEKLHDDMAKKSSDDIRDTGISKEASVDYQINNSNSSSSSNDVMNPSENRTFAGFVNDRMRANSTIQNMQKSYQLGNNTGRSISAKRKSIMNKKKKK